MKIQKVSVASILVATMIMTSCGEKEATTATGAESKSDSAVVEVSTEIMYSDFVNPEMAFVDEALSKKVFTVGELRTLSVLPISGVTLVGYTAGDSATVTYSSQQGKITNLDGTLSVKVARDYTKEKVSFEKGKLIGVKGTTQASYYSVYGNVEENCNIHIHTTEFFEVNEADIVHINNVKNIDPSKPMYLDEFKNAVADFYEQFVGINPMSVSGIIVDIFHSGMKNTDGTFSDAQITIQDEQKTYFTIIAQMKTVPNEKELNALKASKKVVTLSGEFDGGGLKNAELLAQ